MAKYSLVDADLVFHTKTLTCTKVFADMVKSTHTSTLELEGSFSKQLATLETQMQNVTFGML